MIDSVLKGTGNSRFLKSVVPAGTSWADALAMLQAGTFPIDFNGINAEGFQQVGTPLNKANLLKDATAAQIGLPPSTTPDGMFQALGNTGELHVWRKTVKTSSPIPATFKLEDYTADRSDCGGNNVPNALLFMGYGSGYIDVASSITVNDSGGVTLNNHTRYTAGGGETNLPNIILGKYIKIYFSANGPVNLDQSLTYFVPSSSSTGWNGSGSNWIYSTKLQKVVGIPYTPAGTTTTYPVSTNPNAYQEGDDAKEAGYTLGDATSMKVISYVGSSGWYVRFYTADSVTVSTDGVPSIIENNNSAPMISKSSDGSELKGKYIKYHSSYGANTELVEGMIYFVPSDALFTKSNELLTCNKVQLVTGYAAIPAGTTIEYLGKLGDKARVQVVSYVGTGTYGINHKNSLTFDFAPKLIIISSVYNGGYSYVAIIIPGIKNGVALSAYQGGQSRTGYSIISGITDKTVNWYSDSNADAQMNTSGTKYMAIAIG